MIKGKSGFTGKKHSEESKLKMRLAKLGAKYTEERIANHISPMKGRKHTKETKLKMSLASKGVPKSLEHRLNISRVQYKEITDTPWPMRARARKLYQLAYGQIKYCEECKRTNCRIEIHHKDENYNNNDLENLKALCRSCHLKEHYILKKIKKGENHGLQRT